MKQPVVAERFADNGAHSHWELVDPETGAVVASSTVKTAGWHEGYRDGLGRKHKEDHEYERLKIEVEQLRQRLADCQTMLDSQNKTVLRLETSHTQEARLALLTQLQEAQLRIGALELAVGAMLRQARSLCGCALAPEACIECDGEPACAHQLFEQVASDAGVVVPHEVLKSGA